MSRRSRQARCFTRYAPSSYWTADSDTNFTQIGYTVMIVLIEIIIADITSLRSRLFFSYVPAIPFLVSFCPSTILALHGLGSYNHGWLRSQPDLRFLRKFIYQLAPSTLTHYT